MSAKQFDVAVIGAGPAGVAAAIGAARQGSSVILIERRELLGGNATAAMVGTICGISRCGRHLSETPGFDNPGFATDFSLNIAGRSGTSLVRSTHGLTYLPYAPSAFEAACREALSQGKTIEVWTSCSLQGASRAGADSDFTISVTSTHEGRTDLVVRSIVDCSGHSALLQLLGLPTTPPSTPQAASLVFELAELPDLSEELLSLSIRKILREAVLEREIPEELSFVSIVPGSLRLSRALFKLGVRTPENQECEGSSPSALAALYSQAAASIPTIVSCLQRRDPRFHRTVHSRTAPALGIRSGPRGVGEEELSSDTVRHSKRHVNGIALGFWPVELWNTPAGPFVEFPEQGNSYEIPLGSLCAKGAPGVYFGGRSIAATDYAFGSARVIGTSLSTGYAAGWLAAGRLRDQALEAIISSLRREQVEPFYRKSATDK